MFVMEQCADVDLSFRAFMPRIEESLDHNLIEATLGFEDFCLSSMANFVIQFMLSVYHEGKALKLFIRVSLEELSDPRLYTYPV